MFVDPGELRHLVVHYFVTFIDDYSRKEWVGMTLRSKYQVLDVFKLFHVSVGRETGKYLKCIKKDNDGEYEA